MLRDRLPVRLHSALNSYLGKAFASDYVQFKEVYDLRNLYIKIQELLAHGGLQLNPQHKLGMGVLATKQKTDSDIRGLYDFLDTQAIRFL